MYIIDYDIRSNGTWNQDTCPPDCQIRKAAMWGHYDFMWPYIRYRQKMFTAHEALVPGDVPDVANATVDDVVMFDDNVPIPNAPPDTQGPTAPGALAPAVVIPRGTISESPTPPVSESSTNVRRVEDDVALKGSNNDEFVVSNTTIQTAAEPPMVTAASNLPLDTAIPVNAYSSSSSRSSSSAAVIGVHHHPGFADEASTVPPTVQNTTSPPEPPNPSFPSAHSSPSRSSTGRGSA